MTEIDLSTVIQTQLLQQLGDRLRRMRKAQGIGTVEMASRVGLTRNTLRSIEAGDPAPSMGNYLRVMSALGLGSELALLASDTLQAATPNSPAARARQARPSIEVRVRAADAHHQVQDLQSLALHKEAVRLVEADPNLLAQASATLERWLADDGSRSTGLWQEWAGILRQHSWRKVLGRTRRAQELRQASPLVTVLPEAIRRAVLDDVGRLKRGISLGDENKDAAA
jgi:transcriptional regulator with XRE-family HTH domain